MAQLTRNILLPALGGAIGIALMVGLADAAHLPLTLAPFTTSIVLVMSAPDSAFARPRNVFFGHVLSAVAGLVVVVAFGDNPWFAALAVGLAIALMQVTDTMHPPAGINALIMVTAHPAWSFVFLPVALGAATLVAFAWSYHHAAAALTARGKPEEPAV